MTAYEPSKDEPVDFLGQYLDWVDEMEKEKEEGPLSSPVAQSRAADFESAGPGSSVPAGVESDPEDPALD